MVVAMLVMGCYEGDKKGAGDSGGDGEHRVHGREGGGRGDADGGGSGDSGQW